MTGAKPVGIRGIEIVYGLGYVGLGSFDE